MKQPNVQDQHTRQQSLRLLMKGVAEDVKAYRTLQTLLEQQFHAALRYQATPLSELAAQITALVEALEQTRRQRLVLVEHLLGAGSTMAAVFPLVSDSPRTALESGWQLLEQLVLDCKQRNLRNSKLMMEQQDMMQKIMHGEEQIYAPV